MWPSPAEALGQVASSADPVGRVAFACELLLRGVLAYQGAVRAMIAATITRPGLAASRPGIRFGLIDQAVTPFEVALAPPGSPSSSATWPWWSAPRRYSPSPTCAG